MAHSISSAHGPIIALSLTHTLDLLQLGCTVSIMLTTFTLCKRLFSFSPPSLVKFGPGRQVSGATGVLLSPWQPPLTHPPSHTPPAPSLPSTSSFLCSIWRVGKDTQELTQDRTCAHTPLIPSRPLRDLFSPHRPMSGICRVPALLLFQYLPQTVLMSPCEVWSPFPKHAIGQNQCQPFLLTLSPSPLTGHLQWPEACGVPVVVGKTINPLVNFLLPKIQKRMRSD